MWAKPASPSSEMPTFEYAAASPLFGATSTITEPGTEVPPPRTVTGTW